MLIILKKLKVLTLSFLLYSTTSYSEEKKQLFNFVESNKSIIKRYSKLHKKFSRKLCQGRTEPDYWKLTRKFNGNGFYIPVDNNEKLDTQTVSKFIDELKTKEKWIVSQIERLKKFKNFKKYRQTIKKLKGELKQLLIYKQVYFESGNQEERLKAQNQSKYSYISFKKNVLDFFDKVSFFKSYSAPVDHMKLRKKYDSYKFRDDEVGKRKANEIYFYRKIVQDGAQNPSGKKNDRMFRSFIDTIIVEFKKPNDFISEDMRFDLNSVLTISDIYLKRGVKNQIKRMREWRERTQREIKFYNSLINNKVKVGNHTETAKEFISNKFKARYILKDYVLKKSAETYTFWTKEAALMRALYSLETILYNEVGTIDGKDALERKDILQVVLNRYKDSFYSRIDSDESLYPYLKEHHKKLDQYKWLNLLFKEGEFSFTYFFIHGSIRIFCPEMTKRGRKIRERNLELALEALRKPRWDFDAIRYFSRASMLGRIDMRKLWKKHEPLAQNPGLLIRKDKKLKNAYKSGNYNYLYNFIDPNGVKHRVIEINKNEYVLPIDKLVFYKYRNPHYFTYFKEL